MPRMSTERQPVVRTELRISRENAGFSTAAEAAREFGWNQVTYRAHENGQNKFNLSQAKTYGDAFKANPMFLFSSQYQDKEDLDLLFDSDVIKYLLGREELRERLVKVFGGPEWFDDRGNPLARSEREYRSKNAEPNVEIPRFKMQLSAGDGLEIFEQNPEDYIPFTRDFFRKNLPSVNSFECFIVDVEGDSMNPTLPGGSIVMVDRGSTLINGSVMAFRKDNSAFIKRLSMTDKGVEVRSDNPLLSDSTQLLHGLGEDDFQVYGRVCWVAYDMR